MLVECGFTQVQAADGSVWSFAPSLSRVATLGNPHEIVKVFHALHGKDAAQTAPYVLACLCDQDDPLPLIGFYSDVGGMLVWNHGLMPIGEQIILAQHLMRHGIAGKAKPDAGGGEYSPAFDASEYVAAARVHLGMSASDAEALSMTEWQMMFELKFPEAKEKADEAKSLLEDYNDMISELQEVGRV